MNDWYKPEWYASPRVNYLSTYLFFQLGVKLRDPRPNDILFLDSCSIVQVISRTVVYGKNVDGGCHRSVVQPHVKYRERKSSGPSHSWTIKHKQRCQVSTNGNYSHHWKPSNNHQQNDTNLTDAKSYKSIQISIICAEFSATSVQRVGQWRYSSHSWRRHGWLAASRSGRLTLKKHPQYLNDKTLGGTHNRSGNWRREKSLPLTGIDPDSPRLRASSCRLHQGRNFRENICPRASWCLQKDFRCS